MFSQRGLKHTMVKSGSNISHLYPSLIISHWSPQDALRRVTTVEANVKKLEDQALKVSSLLERARDATGAERTALKAEASAFSVKDPLLDRFDL